MYGVVSPSFWGRKLRDGGGWLKLKRVSGMMTRAAACATGGWGGWGGCGGRGGGGGLRAGCGGEIT